MKTLLRIGFLVLIVLGSLLLFSSLIAPKILKSQLQEIVANCSTCVLRVSDISVSFLSGELQLRNIQFTQGDPLFTEISVEIPVVTIQFSVTSLFSKQLNLASIQVESPIVVLTEGDGVYPENQESSSSQTWIISAKDLKISNGIFNYIREYPNNKSALIHIAKIQGQIGPWCSAKEDLITEAIVDGELEESGKFLLNIQTPLFASKNNIKVDLNIEGLNLSDLNQYFLPSEGIELKGRLLHGSSSVSIREENLKAWVTAKYEHLDIDFKKTKKRTAWITFLSNLAESLKMPEANISDKTKDQTRGVTLIRKPRESIVSFILRGMKDSALRVATGS